MHSEQFVFVGMLPVLLTAYCRASPFPIAQQPAFHPHPGCWAAPGAEPYLYLLPQKALAVATTTTAPCAPGRLALLPWYPVFP